MLRRFTEKQLAGVRVQRREDKSATIEGYAAVFYSASDAGSEYRLWDNWYERIMPGAFDRALREKQDVRGLFNHDSNCLLGRTTAKTLRLAVDSKGLRYEIDVAETQSGRDTTISIERGDLSGSSFAFVPKRTVWIEEDDRIVRQIEDVDLFDVGPVTYPAYDSTSATVRSAEREALQQEIDEWRRAHPGEAEAIAVRLRQLDVDNVLVGS